ncbi:hypothetical protein KKE60_06470 [Patescibacteria group bacterium]|nr:hypothetical protein [Patescibacteria group bacterium]
MKLSDKFKRQYNLGPGLGAFKDLASRTMIYVSVLSFTQISATFYYTTFKPSITQLVPWMSFGLYFIVLIVLVLLIMLIEYKFIVPSSFTFQNKQEYLHENLIRKDIRELTKKLERLEELLNESRNNSPDK